MPTPPFELIRPANQDTPVIFASPHSGRNYPRSFLRKSVLDELQIRSSEDAFVDILFENAPEFGAPLLKAIAPRAFLDLNRAVDELDGAVVHDVNKAHSNPRVASGLGVIPRVVASGRAIYRGKISREEADKRLRNYWRPYHDALGNLMYETRKEFGQAVLLDCHSMPHEAVDAIAHKGLPRPEVIIGDRFGSSAAPEIVDRIEAAFVRAGLVVVRNVPFAGAYVTNHYGRPSQDQHAIQIEIDRSLYMNEKTIRPNDNFAAFRKLMTSVAADIAKIRPDKSQQLAAE